MSSAHIERMVVVTFSLAIFLFTPVASGQDANRQNLVHDGITRSYVLRTPAKRLRPDAPVPLVLVLHGGGGNAPNAEQMTGFTEKARREGFIVAYPEGSGRLKTSLLTWNVGHCCGYAMENNVDDVGFIRALIDELSRRYPVDPRRIYVTGMSNGGMMTHRLGIELSDRVAAIAPVVATVFGDEKKPPHAVSALMINGSLDENVPPAGGAPGGRGTQAWDGTPTRPALEQGTFWASNDSCKPDATKSDTKAWTRWLYTCPTGTSVELYLVKDNGHAWPGGKPGSRRGDRPSKSLDATDVIWDFFKAHSR
jgi:polyhydroxybutyrate depolymerase